MVRNKILPALHFMRFLLLIATLAATSLSACDINQSDQLIDRSFSTSQPCAAPCWYGLRLDQSTRDDLRTTLQRLPFVDSSSIQEAETTWQNDEHATDVGWSCTHPKRDSCGGSARLSGNRLKDLSLSIDYTLTFSDTIQKLGSPGYIRYFDAFWLGKCEMSLFWTDKGISVDGELPKTCPTLTESKKGIPLNPNIQVTNVRYGLPSLMQAQVVASDAYLPWPGLKESAFSFFDFVPGSLGMWLVLLLTLVMLVTFAVRKRHWRSPIYSFALAAIAVLPPTLELQWSDVITPMCGAYFINTLICGTVYAVIAELIRQKWPQRAKAAEDIEDQVENRP